MSKEVKELLIPRYKVIADYPGNRFKMGAIFTKDIDGTFVDEEMNVTLESNLTSFPHLFKKLEWWEDRLPEEMPEYVKHDGTIYQISSPDIDIRNNYGFVLKTDVIPIYYKDCQPATEQEYTQYINSKQP